MNQNPFAIRPAQSTDIPTIIALLDDNSLPSSDISAALHNLYVATQHDLLVGLGGLEVAGSYGLIRSVVTTTRFRGTGFGRKITEYLIDKAKESGLTEVYLLTTTADGFFARLGFERRDRAAVPPEICETSEFRELSPASAVFMCKPL